MKTLNLLFLLVAFVAISFSSCKNVKMMVDRIDEVKYEVKPSPLEMHGGKVEFEVTVTFPGEYFLQKAALEATTALKYEGGEKELETLKAQGEDYEGQAKEISFATGGSVTVKNTLDYEDAMRMSTVEITGITATMKGKSMSVPVEALKKYNPLAVGIITTPLLVEQGLQVDNAQKSEGGDVSKYPQTVSATESLVQQKEKSISAKILYPLQSANISTSEKKEEDIAALIEKTKTAGEEEMTFNRVEISSYASPDGPIDLNKGLVDKRGKSAEKFLTYEFKKEKVDAAANEEAYKKTTTPDEDWAGFKSELAKSSVRDKEIIQRVLSKYNDPVKREEEIKNIAAAYNELRTSVLPQLRRSEIKLVFDLKVKTDAEILNMALNNPSELNNTEMLHAAKVAKTEEEQLKVYQNYKKQFPDDWRGYNNVGVIFVNQDKLSEAKTEFETAKTKEGGDNGSVLNNLGVIAFADGDYETAKELFLEAETKGSAPNEVKYNLGVIFIMEGDYAKAENYLNAAPCTFNTALAQLLNNNNTGRAKKTLDCMENGDFALVYYLKAIIGARTENTDMLFTNLRKAVEKDANLKEYAKNDAEFANYFEDNTFKSLIK